MIGMHSLQRTVRSIGAVLALVGLVGAAATLLLLADSGGDEVGARPARSAQPPQPEEFFGVLRQPPSRTSSSAVLQRLHKQVDGLLPPPSGTMGEIDPSKTRYLGTFGGLEQFLLAGSDVICTATREADADIGFTIGCDPVSRYVDGHVSVQSGKQPDGSIRVTALVPDVVRDVKVQDSQSAQPRALQVENNVVATTTSHDGPRFIWTDQKGTHERGIMAAEPDPKP